MFVRVYDVNMSACVHLNARICVAGCMKALFVYKYASVYMCVCICMHTAVVCFACKHVLSLCASTCVCVDVCVCMRVCLYVRSCVT